MGPTAVRPSARPATTASHRGRAPHRTSGTGTGAHGRGGPETPPRGSGPGWRLLAAAPDLLTAGLAGFSLVAVALLLADAFRAPLVLGLGLPAALVAAAVVGVEPVPAGRTARLAPLAALLLAGAWTLVNAVFSAQIVFDTRDPATYAIAGQLLTAHDSVRIATAPDVLGDLARFVPFTAGFGYDGPGRVYAQGGHLLPALLAVGGWAGGPAVLLKVNAALGGLALLAFFGLVRRVAGGGWALVAMAALAASLPMIMFSRATYTEPVTLAFLAAGFSLLWRAIGRGRLRDFAVAGLVLGGAPLARIDGYVALLAVLVVAVALLAAAPAGARRPALARVAVLVVGAGIPTALAFADVTRLSGGYYYNLRGQVVAIGYAGIALAAAGAVVVALCWGTRRVPRLVRTHRTRLAALAAGIVAMAFGILASRPAWLVSRQNDPAGFASLGALQRSLQLPVDPSRSYDELTLSWISWYFGWPTVALAVLGLALLVWRLLRRADLRFLVPVVPPLVMGAVYFNKASIFPDQLWAMRRFLPVVIPGLLLAAVALLAALWATGSWRRPLAVLGAGALVVVPCLVSAPVVSIREGVPQLTEVRRICAAVGNRAGVLTVDDDVTDGYVMTIRAFCGVPAQGLPRPTPAELATVQRAARDHGRALFVVSGSPEVVPFAEQPPPYSRLTMVKLSERLLDVPRTPSYYDRPLWIGRVGADGRVVPLPPLATTGRS